jgi:hypothetical protein
LQAAITKRSGRPFIRSYNAWMVASGTATGLKVESSTLNPTARIFALKIWGMSRRFCVFVLLTAIFLQAMAAFGTVAVAQRASELAHLMAHCQDANHHHHADNALHMDDDGGALQHMHADSGSSPAGLLSSAQHPLARARSVAPPELRLSIWLSPTLEGPLRPPMQRA